MNEQAALNLIELSEGPHAHHGAEIARALPMEAQKALARYLCLVSGNPDFRVLGKHHSRLNTMRRATAALICAAVAIEEKKVGGGKS